MALFVVAVVAALVALSAVLLRDHNQLDVERHDIEARWDQLDRDMKQRASLVPDLPDSKALLAAKTRQDEMAANYRLSSAIRMLQRRKMSDDLAHAQQSFATDRTEYNDAIEKYNTDLELFPKNMVAAIFGFKRDDLYVRSPEEQDR